MKKWTAVLMALMMCLCVGAAYAQQESPMMYAVAEGYEEINQSGDNGIYVPLNEEQNGMLQVDLISETDTLVRPYIFVEMNADFYQIKHTEEDFGGLFSYTLNLLSQMQQSEEHQAATALMKQELLPEGVGIQDTTFKGLSYVPDPNQQCEVIFTGVTNGQEGDLIRGEVYAFCRFPMMGEGNMPLIMNALVTEQRAVYEIARMAHQTGRLSAEMDAWILKMLGM